MKPERCFPTRVLAAFLALSAGLPGRALALRNESADSPRVRSGLEEALEEEPYDQFARVLREQFGRGEYRLVSRVAGGDLRMGMAIFKGTNFRNASGIIFRHLRGEETATLLIWIEGALRWRSQVPVQELARPGFRILGMREDLRTSLRPPEGGAAPTIQSGKEILKEAMALFGASVRGPHYLKMLSRMVEQGILTKIGIAGAGRHRIHVFQTRDGLWELRTAGGDLAIYAGSAAGPPGDFPVAEGGYIELTEKVRRRKRTLTIRAGVMRKQVVPGGVAVELRSGKPTTVQPMEAVLPEPGEEVYTWDSEDVASPWFRGIQYESESGTLEATLSPGKEGSRLALDTRRITPRFEPQPYGEAYQDPRSLLPPEPQRVRLWLMGSLPQAVDGPSTQAGMEENDEAILAAALADPERASALSAGKAVMLPDGTHVLEAPSRMVDFHDLSLYLQQGHEGPPGMPRGTRVVGLGRTVSEVVDVWEKDEPHSTDIILYNAEHVPDPTAMAAAMPTVHPMPAMVRARPQEGGIPFKQLVVAARVAQHVGKVLDLETLSISFLQVGPTTYAIIRSA